MNRLRDFSVVNPTGSAPGMEPVRLDVLRAGVENAAAAAAAPTPSPIVAHSLASIPLINKNIRLPLDLVEFIDFVYTKDRRMKKQDAYTEALEAFFRPLMDAASK